MLDTHELGRRPGSTRTVARTVPAPDELGTGMIGVPSGSDLELDLRLEAVMEGVLVTGSIRGEAVGECVRCLERVVEPLDVPLQELYVYPERAQAAVAEGDEDEDVRELEDDLVDLEPALRDAVVTALPFRPLCGPDCPGLCSECGARLADDPDHQHETIDPRWAALGGLTSTDDEQRES
ncbi:YceD family protein [Cellulomonas sp. NPDC057328]|uniref:YceD family protein n=1 Tax=unclassified Cellulomonas TaxID=2620175 RepID=UPI003645C810